ncbi:MAG: DUF2341 domain-containing protein [Candidatus Yanofskybacteria bacterium]|nr:DUF2341 domain-containing protein [Candidatus Yanofskybacteria bacterium]
MKITFNDFSSSLRKAALFLAALFLAVLVLIFVQHLQVLTFDKPLGNNNRGYVLAAAITIGETNILSLDDSRNANLLVAQNTLLSQSATIQSLSFYITTAAGSLRLGIYDATGPGGGPGAKRAETASFTPVTGWNTTNVISPVSLPAGTYWLAYLPSSNTLAFRKNVTAGISGRYYSFIYGTMPVTFSTAPSTTSSHWSLYATLETVPDTTVPVISAVTSSSVTSSGATITWTTDESSDTQVEYGLTTAYGNSTILNTSPVTAHSQTISGLSASTLWHYRVKSKDSSGNLATSGDFTFTTTAPDTTAPVISAVTSSSITSSGATITWTTNEASDTQVEYGTTTSYGFSTALNTSLVAAHSANLTGLTASTLYHYRVKSKDASSNLATSGDFTFTTAVATVSSYNIGWNELLNTKIRAVCPPNNFGGTTYDFGFFCEWVTGAWGGAMADTMRDRLIIWGGGHNDYYGNEIYSLNLGANPITMTRLNDPSVPIADSSCPETMADGKPNSRHTYGGLAYVQHADRMYAHGGSRACAAGNTTSATWTLNLSTLQWTRMDPTNGPTQASVFNNVVLSDYDPNTRLVFATDTSKFWSYNYDTNTYALLNGFESVPFESNGVIDPVKKLFIFFGTEFGNSGAFVKAISIAPGSNYAVQDWSAQASTGGCGALMSARYPGLSYDPILDRIVGWPNSGNTVYLFNPDTKTCTSQTFAGGPINSSEFNGTFGRLRYIPSLNAHVLVNDIDNNAYILKLTSGSGATPPPPDTTAPVISAVTSSSVTSSGATITWTTDESSDTQVEYGLTTAYGNSTILNTSAVTAHSQTISGLSASTLWHYRVKSKDSSGNLATSGDFTFTTTTPDTTAPSVPTNLTATVISSSQINLSWTASTDNVGVTGYRIFRNGIQAGTSVTTSYNDTGLTPSTAYSYTVSAFDAAGNVSGQSTMVGATTLSLPASGYSFSRVITIDHLKVPNTDQANFPVLVSGTYNYLATVPNGGKAQNSNGHDIVFATDSTCLTLLNWEMETYNSATGVVNAWVKIPNVSHLSDTTFAVCYGNPAISSFQGNVAETWNAGYTGVWHLSNGATLNAVNSVNGVSGTISGSVATSGRIDGAASFDGAGDSIRTDVTLNNSARSYEFWALRTSEGENGLGRYFEKQTGGANAELLYNNVYNGDALYYSRFFSNGQAEWAVAPPSAGVFHHIVVTYDSSLASNDPIFYVDGAAKPLIINFNASGIASVNADAYVIGNRIPTNNRSWHGKFDEVRIVNSVLSADWVQTEYNNQSSPSTFYSVGIEQIK